MVRPSPFTGAIEDLRDAFVVPERAHDAKLASGVLDAEGQFREISRAWIRARRSTPPPTLAPDEPVQRLPGSYLFAGHIRGHFGHFLVESTARLWALEALEGQVDGILYLPYRGNAAPAAKAIRGHRDFFRLLGVTVPVETHPTALQVERLFVPELGFGWLERYAGSPAYRQCMRERLGLGIAPEGGEKLYVSRAGLMAARGGILGETLIEQAMAAAGYEVFRPEKHPLEVQIARYKAARQIVALDGSALHFAAFFLAPGARVAIILRRSKANFADYVLQYRSFCGVEPDIVNVIRRDWVSGEVLRSDYRSVGELDFAALFARLKALGYLPAGAAPEVPDAAALQAMLDRFSERRGDPFTALEAGRAPAEDDDGAAD